MQHMYNIPVGTPGNEKSDDSTSIQAGVTNVISHLRIVDHIVRRSTGFLREGPTSP